MQADDRDPIPIKLAPPYPYDDVTLPQPPISNADALIGNFRTGTETARTASGSWTIVGAGNDDGKRTGHLQSELFQVALERHETALRIIVGGYTGEGDSRRLAGASCRQFHLRRGRAAVPVWSVAGIRGWNRAHLIATPQVAAALDTVWVVWPDMDILDLRNLAFDCAQNMPVRGRYPAPSAPIRIPTAAASRRPPTRPGAMASCRLTCLFTPNGGLQDPTTGEAISGGIFGRDCRSHHRRLDHGAGGLHRPRLRLRVRPPRGARELRIGRHGERASQRSATK